MGHWTNRFWWDRTQRLNGALDKQVWVIQGLGGIEHRGWTNRFGWGSIQRGRMRHWNLTYDNFRRDDLSKPISGISSMQE